MGVEYKSKGNLLQLRFFLGFFEPGALLCAGGWAIGQLRWSSPPVTKGPDGNAGEERQGTRGNWARPQIFLVYNKGNKGDHTWPVTKGLDGNAGGWGGTRGKLGPTTDLPGYKTGEVTTLPLT